MSFLTSSRHATQAVPLYRIMFKLFSDSTFDFSLVLWCLQPSSDDFAFFFFRVKKSDYADVTSLGIISMLCFLPFALLTPHNTLPSPQSHVVNVFPFLPLLPSSPVQPSFTLTSFTVVFPPLHPALLILIIKSLTAGRRTLRRKHKQFLMRSRQVTDFFTRML